MALFARARTSTTELSMLAIICMAPRRLRPTNYSQPASRHIVNVYIAGPLRAKLKILRPEGSHKLNSKPSKVQDGSKISSRTPVPPPSPGLPLPIPGPPLGQKHLGGGKKMERENEMAHTIPPRSRSGQLRHSAACTSSPRRVPIPIASCRGDEGAANKVPIEQAQKAPSPFIPPSSKNQREELDRKRRKRRRRGPDDYLGERKRARAQVGRS